MTGARLRILVLAALAIAAWLALAMALAAAHGTAEAIGRLGIKNAVGELCCGERDCAELAAGDVEITAAGYRIKSLNETVPFNEALPMPRELLELRARLEAEGGPLGSGYWRCFWGGKRKCFFAPPPNT